MSQRPSPRPIPAPRAAKPVEDTEALRALRLLEQLVAETGDELAVEAPEQLARMKRLLVELRQGRGMAGNGSEAAALVRGLFVWQLELARTEYLGRVAGVWHAAAEGNPTASLEKRAFEGVVLALDEALATLRKPGASTAALEAAAARAGAALQAAEEASRKAHQPVIRSLRPAPGTPALAPAVARPFAAARPSVAADVRRPAPQVPLAFKPPPAPLPVRRRAKPGGASEAASPQRRR